MPGISDHAAVFSEVSITPINTRKIWLYRHTDWQGMASHLQLRLDHIDQQYHAFPDSHWTAIKTAILEAMEAYISMKKPKRKDSCLWITKELHKLIKIRNGLYRRVKKRGCPKLQPRYLLYYSLVKQQQRKSTLPMYITC